MATAQPAEEANEKLKAWEAALLVSNIPKAAAVALLLNPLWMILDYSLYPATFSRILWPRLAVIELGSFVALLLSRTRHRFLTTIITFVSVQVGAALVVTAANGPDDPYVSGIIFTIVGEAALVPVTPRWHLLSHLLMLASFLLGCSYLHPQDTAATYQQFFVLSCVSITTIFGLMLFQKQKLREISIEVELAHTNQKLESTNHRLTQALDIAKTANKAKSTFLANMSHELRTPLNAVIGYSELLREEAEELQPEWTNDLDRIRDAGQYLLQLINDILDLSKIAAGKLEVHPKPLPIELLIEDLTPMVKILCAKNRNHYSTASLPVTAIADPVRVRQILLNLLSNAAKFTTNGAVSVRVAETEDTCEISVTDTGRGMSPDQAEALFQPFVQVHDTEREQFGGTGLGLALSRDLAREMGGDLYAQSELGKGSVFTLILPRARSPQAAPPDC